MSFNYFPFKLITQTKAFRWEEFSGTNENSLKINWVPEMGLWKYIYKNHLSQTIIIKDIEPHKSISKINFGRQVILRMLQYRGPHADTRITIHKGSKKYKLKESSDRLRAKKQNVFFMIFLIFTIQTVITFSNTCYLAFLLWTLIFISFGMFYIKIILIFEHGVSILEHRPNDLTI